MDVASEVAGIIALGREDACEVMLHLCAREVRITMGAIALGAELLAPAHGCARAPWRSWQTEDRARRLPVQRALHALAERLDWQLDRLEWWARELAKARDAGG